MQHFGEYTASIFNPEDGDCVFSKTLAYNQNTTQHNPEDMLQYHDNHKHRFSSWPVQVTRIKTAPSTSLLDNSGSLYASTP
jgi:hypothetical protein